MKLAIMAMLLAFASTVSASDEALRGDLALLATKRIYFAHQSVGANILQGVTELARAQDVPLRIVRVPRASDVPTPGFGHFFVPENGAPLEKLANFETALGADAGIDIALIKFCYVDIDANTDAAMLFARYQATVAKLRSQNPRTIFVHVTLPLTTVQTGPKAFAKRLLGRAPYGTIENVRREQYNALMRRAYAGREPLFDLARLESHAPDGTLVTVAWEGSTAPAMASDYTDDGGHLNARGRDLAARELVRVLAAAARPLQKIDGFATRVRLSR